MDQNTWMKTIATFGRIKGDDTNREMRRIESQAAERKKEKEKRSVGIEKIINSTN